MESADNILQASAWHNVVLTYENESIKLYVDGQVVASNLTDTIDLNPTGLLENFVVGSNMTGCVDEIQFYNKVLTTEEVGHIAYEGNYSATLANYDLKFNELTVEPTQVIDSKTGARYNTSNANYEDGFVEGSKSIRFTNGGDVSLGNVDLSQKNAVSISTWVNLDALTNTGQTIVKKDGVIDMSIDNKDIKLTLGSTPILFTLTNPTAPMLSDEKFSFSDPTTAFNGTRLESYESGASSTNTIPAFYTNQMTISSWVKTSNTSKQNIISVGENVHVGLNNNNTIECDVDKLTGLATTTIGVSSFNIENANYSGDIFNSVGIGTDSIDFDVASPNSLQTYKLKRFTFGVPFRNYAPTSVSIVGVNGSTETTLVTQPITFKNSSHVYDIVLDDTNAAIDNNKIKVKFNGSGAIKVKNVGVESVVEDSITATITSDAKTVTISGTVSRQGTLNVYSDNTNRIEANKLSSVVVSGTSFTVTFEDTRNPGIYEYYLSINDGTKIVNFQGLNLSVQINDPVAPPVTIRYPRYVNTYGPVEDVNPIQYRNEFIVEYFAGPWVTMVDEGDTPWGRSYRNMSLMKVDEWDDKLLTYKPAVSNLSYTDMRERIATTGGYSMPITPWNRTWTGLIKKNHDAWTRHGAGFSGYHNGTITSQFKCVLVSHPATGTWAIWNVGGAPGDHNDGPSNDTSTKQLLFHHKMLNNLNVPARPVYLRWYQFKGGVYNSPRYYRKNEGGSAGETFTFQFYGHDENTNLNDYDYYFYYHMHGKNGGGEWMTGGIDTTWGARPTWIQSACKNRANLFSAPLSNGKQYSEYKRAREFLIGYNSNKDYIQILNNVNFADGQEKTWISPIAWGNFNLSNNYLSLSVIVKHKITGRECHYNKQLATRYARMNNGTYIWHIRNVQTGHAYFTFWYDDS